MRGGTPDITMRQHSLTKKERKAIASYLHRALRKALAHTWPTVRLVRSMALDETLYSSFVINALTRNTLARRRSGVSTCR
jgi:hypothetical protein